MRAQILLPLALLSLAACTGDGYSSFSREAGALVDTGNFGNATMANTQAMTNPAGYAASLQGRFGAEVETTVTFAFNSAVLDPVAMAVLSRQAAWIRQFPEVRFKVFGHADLVGSPAYNRALGMRRAEAVVAYFASQGISRSRLVAAVSYGDTRPVVMTEERERANRRAVTEVLGFVENHPNVLDGKYAEIIYRGYVESAAAGSRLTGGGLTSTAGGSNGGGGSGQ